MHFSYEELHPDLGLAVTGIDLGQELSDSEMDELLDTFARKSVLAIRGQHIGPQDQVRFLKRFGTPKISQRKEFHLPGHPEIGKVGNVRNPDGTPAAFLDRYGNLWHSDTASDTHVDAVTMLYCVKTPPVGGDTLFCSMHAAYERLPAALKAQIEGKKVVHNFNKHNDYLLARNAGSAKPLSEEDRAKWPDRIHDLVQRHPKTGRPLYFVSPTLVKTIGDLSEADSAALAETLVAHATKEPHVLRYKWSAGDLILWDNRACMHSASPANYGGGERLMHRAYAYL